MFLSHQSSSQNQSLNLHSQHEKIMSEFTELKDDLDQALHQLGIDRDQLANFQEILEKLEHEDRSVVAQEVESFKNQIRNIENSHCDIDQTNIHRQELRQSVHWISMK